MVGQSEYLKGLLTEASSKYPFMNIGVVKEVDYHNLILCKDEIIMVNIKNDFTRNAKCDPTRFFYSKMKLEDDLFKVNLYTQSPDFPTFYLSMNESQTDKVAHYFNELELIIKKEEGIEENNQNWEDTEQFHKIVESEINKHKVIYYNFGKLKRRGINSYYYTRVD